MSLDRGARRQMTALRRPTDRLAAELAGRVLLPSDAEYDAGRKVWNGMFDRRPAAIAQCTGVADVVAAVRFAREQGLPICVRGGGHALDGNTIADDALEIDFSQFAGVFVDRSGPRAIVQAGARWGQVDRETQLHGLAVTGGPVSHTGVAGVTLGGGIGWLMRKHGTSAANVLSIDAVTVEGRVVHASADEHPDLFWAMRGGGGNFAIATSLEFQLHRLGPVVLAGGLMHRAARARDFLRFWRSFMDEAPEEVASIATLVRAPTLPFYPPELHGTVLAVAQICYLGDPADGEEVLRPLRAWGPPFADQIQPQAYVAWQKRPELTFPQTATPGAARWYGRCGHLRELTDEVIDESVAAAERSPVATDQHPDVPIIALWRLGGALARMPADAMAFTCSNAGYLWESTANWQDVGEDERWISWQRSFAASLEPHSTTDLYLNLTSEDQTPTVQRAYGERYARLAEAKRQWDPDNVLRFNKNIAPAS